MEDEYSDKKMEEILGKIYEWFIEFSESRYFNELTEEQRLESEFVIMSFTEYMYSYHGLSPEKWDEEGLEECCLETLQRKLTANESYFKSVAPVLSAFFAFLGEKGLIRNASNLAKRVKEINKQIVINASYPENWGMAKSFLMAAKDAGADITNIDEIRKFMGLYNLHQAERFKRDKELKSEHKPKVGRNVPCPCGSGKKFKKCCMNKPAGGDSEHSEQLDNMMQRGYGLIEEGRVKDACTLWLQVWEHLKGRFTQDMKSIDDAEGVFSGMQSLYNWCQDIEMELGNAGIEDMSFFEKRIRYCQEFCNLFPDTDSLIIQNMKWAEAESCFGLGMLEQGEKAFEALIEEFPDSVWGYIGWGDMYCSFRLNDAVPLDYEKAERIYRMAIDRNVEDKTEVLNRLKELEKEKASKSS